jgi:aspartate-semialdehyde dehydrogenase
MDPKIKNTKTREMEKWRRNFKQIIENRKERISVYVFCIRVCVCVC